METSYRYNSLSIDDLRKKAKSKMPGFVFEFLDLGCNDGVNIAKNTKEIRDIELKPIYLREYQETNLQTELFGHIYDAPFGISPIGLQGLMWPNAPEILAKASVKHNIPFIVSTVTTSSIERLGEITEGQCWFQMYNPAENDLRHKIMKRVEDVGCPVLVIVSDAPTSPYRPWDIRNGMGLPPKKSLKNILQILARPEWTLKTLYHGIPTFANMVPYLRSGSKLNFSGTLSEQKIAEIRDKWKKKLVIKGIASEEDTELAIKWGLDGIIVSNHGGRQLDAGQSSIKTLAPIVKKYQGKIKIMLDSGLRTGPDIARTMASGAEFTFLGRSFMYAVAALGNEGGDLIVGSLKVQLKQVMEQICCASVPDLKNHLVPPCS